MARESIGRHYDRQSDLGGRWNVKVSMGRKHIRLKDPMHAPFRMRLVLGMWLISQTLRKGLEESPFLFQM